MATKSKKSKKSSVKIGTLSKPKKALVTDDMKKVKGGATHNYVGVEKWKY